MKKESKKEKKQKGRKSRTLLWVIGIVVVIGIIGSLMGGGNSDADASTEASASSDTEEVNVESETEDSSEVEDTQYSELAYLNMSRDELLAVYNAYDALLLSEDTTDLTTDEVVAYEDSCAEQIAEEYGITADDVDAIYLYGSTVNYFATFDVDSVELKFGELVSVATWGSQVVIEAKIESQLTNQQTIDQNYYNVCDFIRNYSGTDFDEISYWAIADMSDGSESKVISFDLSGDIINTIATGDFADNTLGDYAEDLYIHPSLQ